VSFLEQISISIV